MTAAEAMKKMIEYSAGDRHDILHLLKVWGYAKTIAELEGIDGETRFILEIAAIVHDIACPLCRKKYGSTNGKLQEAESAPLVREFLRDGGFTAEQTERIVYLVCHHHTYTDVDGADYRILLEADYLVNADEGGFSAGNIASAREQIFRTETGKALLKEIYGLH